MEAQINRDAVLDALQQTAEGYITVLSGMNEQQINAVPFEGSWTPGQVIRHITKANGSDFLLQKDAKAERNIAERVPELKKIFLDYTVKMQSPEFILPEDKKYSKEECLEALKTTFQQLDTNTRKAELDELVEGMPFGPVTKWELINFMLFHSQRHLHQLKKIADIISDQ